MNQGNRHSLASIFDLVTQVEIPIIQRDFAQGRAEVFDVRIDFLNALRDCLIRDDDDVKARLNLDFVYGCFEPGANSNFSVLDGQQRLTTLFLLHWYFSVRENMSDDFRGRFSHNGHARFSYATRPSSTEFFDALVREDFTPPTAGTGSLSASMTDCNWFFLSWRQDPTVQSCLGMLNDIHAIFGADHGMYTRLVAPAPGRITFQFLNLPDFGLSDDLYIKMNARGKPLTSFENFKAWIIGRISHLRDASAFDAKMDQAWLDVFWRMARSQAALSSDLGFDDLYLRFFYLMAFYEACEQASSGYWSLPKPTQIWIERLRRPTGAIPHSAFEAQQCFSQNTLARIARVLDYLSGEPEANDLALCQRALISNEFLAAAEFYTVVSAICSEPCEASPKNSQSRIRWTRVTRNLIYNSRIDEISSFILTIRGILALSQQYEALYEHLAEAPTNVFGFTREQVNEEILKSRLILEDLSWEPLFHVAEGHYYLQGKIGFLLDFSRESDVYSQSRFQTYSDRTASVLSYSILQANDFVFQRALLAIFDYLVPQSSGRFSFCTSHSVSFRERSENWLRVVTRAEFRQLLDKIDIEPRPALERIIASASCKDWRKHIVADPAMIAYCKHGLLKRDGDTIYLLSKSKMSSFHVELYSYGLYKELQRRLAAGSVPLKIALVSYQPVYDGVPYLSVTGADGTAFTITGQNAQLVCLASGDGIEVPTELSTLLMQFVPNGSA